MKKRILCTLILSLLVLTACSNDTPKETLDEITPTAIIETQTEETMVTTSMCYVGVIMVCVSLFIAVVRGKTCLPKWCCLINTLTLTVVVGILLAGMGAMNVASSLMFLGLFMCIKKFSKKTNPVLSNS